jgi:hypothetical protein
MHNHPSIYTTFSALQKVSDSIFVQLTCKKCFSIFKTLVSCIGYASHMPDMWHVFWKCIKYVTCCMHVTNVMCCTHFKHCTYICSWSQVATCVYMHIGAHEFKRYLNNWTFSNFLCKHCQRLRWRLNMHICTQVATLHVTYCMLVKSSTWAMCSSHVIMYVLQLYFSTAC